MRGEWKFPQVADAPVEIIDGDRGINYPKQADFGLSGHCLFLNTGNVTLTGFDFSDCAFVTKEKDEALRKGKLKRCDVVLTTRGTVGNVAFYDASVPFQHVRLNSGMVILRANQDELLPRYLYLFLRSQNFKDQVASLSTGSAQPQLPIRDIRKVEIPLPPLSEQRWITQVLGALDDEIELNRRMNETLEAMARALFQNWFVDATQAGLPKGWTVRALYDCANYINGSAFRHEHFSSERLGLPIIKIGELKDGITDQTKFTEETLEPKYRITSGEILFSWSGSPDTSINTFVWSGRDGWLNQHIFKIQFMRPVEKFFVYYLLRHFMPEFIEIARNKQTTGLGHVTAQDLKRLKTAFPPDDVLIEFNRIAEPLFQKSYNNDCESRTLAALRDALLPKLLSGEIQVREGQL